MKRILIMSFFAALCLVVSQIASADTNKRIGIDIGGTAADYRSTVLGNSLYSPSNDVQVYIAVKTSGTSYCGSSEHKSAVAATGGYQYKTSSYDPAITFDPASATGPAACVLP